MLESNSSRCSGQSSRGGVTRTRSPPPSTAPVMRPSAFGRHSSRAS
ncbi:hypothetical protein MBEHAL_1197 [Halarchaeum acidiphilum MH1-52-1]|uniref:Uncharacterized protein n=1 Tax=Halarchaeum acidiphilum MH1-52-1 TaxID=1261545 RepID=U2YUL0_9EURY|nr:hypothetical protein MBEHAL_1197 [Halarchaeum acidiphilum MH1-52-1]